MSKKYFMLPPTYGYSDMFEDHGWEKADYLTEADIIVFTGGEDVDPALYGHDNHPSTHFNKERDRKEKVFFDMALIEGTPMVGICRGGQFLNVMNGGEMYQDVNGHAIIGTHSAIDKFTGEMFQVTSTHHQMMKPSRMGLVLVTANESTFKEECPFPGKTVRHLTKNEDVEVVYYNESNSLCFQPHPEHPGHNELAKRFFDYVEEYLFDEE